MRGETRSCSGLRADDEGFTLIELLVVIIIIGILAAIAIPTYLGQRQKANDSAAKTDLRTLAEFEETYAASTTAYGDLAQLDADGSVMRPTRAVTVTVVRFTGTGFCLSSKSAFSPNTFWYDSQAGGMQAAGSSACPVVTAGTAGAARTG